MDKQTPSPVTTFRDNSGEKRRLTILLHFSPIFFGIVLSVLLLPPIPAMGAYAPAKNVVIVSSPIKPYLLALNGIIDEFKDSGAPAPSIRYLNKFIPKNLTELAEIIRRENPQSCITIGPEATSFAWNYLPQKAIKKVYTMLAAPDTVIKRQENSPTPLGISLDIPTNTQLEAIKCFLPGTKKIGILYNPTYSQSLVATLQQASASFNLEIIPLKINSSSGIKEIFRSKIEKIDALLFIPDPDVAFESIITFLIKEGINRKIPTIGFNRFFYDNGAAISTIIDYYRTGRRTVKLLNQSKTEQTDALPVPHSPYIITWLNQQVIKYVSSENFTPAPMCQDIEVGP